MANTVESAQFDSAIEELLAIREAIELFEANRYANAAAAFEPIYESLNQRIAADDRRALDTWLVISDYYIQSLSQQGQVEGVNDKMMQRHAWVSRLYDHNDYVYGSSLSRLAEANYRAGETELAVAQAYQALSIFKALNPVPEEAVRLVRQNVVQYQLTSFDKRMLPMDLSAFYTSCESLSSLPISAIDTVMADYVEVGVDYLPDTAWAAYYDQLRKQTQTLPQGNVRLFIPDTAHLMRSELCAVESPTPILSAATGE